jgi:glycerate kinase
VPHLLAAPDKLKGTASAKEVAGAAGRAARRAGWSAGLVPMSDGGDGLLEAIGGARRQTVVEGPLGGSVQAEWRLEDDTAVIESARASGLVLAGGPERNDAMAASTAGTGQLIAAAVSCGARRVIVGVGGSATTDGGWGAVRALGGGARLHGVELVVACDVTTPFLEAAAVFGPQKGAGPSEVRLLEGRLRRLAQMYRSRFGVDVTSIPGAGAAGGLAGGLAALGATLVPGFELVAEHLELAERMSGADLVVTAEGRLDEQSFEGKVVGGVAREAAAAGVPVLVVTGELAPGTAVPGHVEVRCLSELYGREASLGHPLDLVEKEVAAALQPARGRGRRAEH